MQTSSETVSALGASAAAPARPGGELEVRQVLREGELVAVLMAIDQGDTYTVVAEVFADGSRSATRRPYTFASAEAAHAFLAEALTSFMYLGCEIRDL